MSVGFVAVSISLVALGVSIWSVIESKRAAKEHARIHGRLLSLESVRERDRQASRQQARLRAAIHRMGRLCQLVLENEGEATAHAIHVRVNDTPVEDFDAILVGEDEIARILAPGAHVEYTLAASLDGPFHYRVAVEWEDASGQPGRWESDLRVP